MTMHQGSINTPFLLINQYYQSMTYDKEARTIAGTTYVREVTRWPGHTHVVNLPVEYD